MVDNQWLPMFLLRKRVNSFSFACGCNCKQKGTKAEVVCHGSCLPAKFFPVPSRGQPAFILLIRNSLRPRQPPDPLLGINEERASWHQQKPCHNRGSSEALWTPVVLCSDPCLVSLSLLVQA